MPTPNSLGTLYPPVLSARNTVTLSPPKLATARSARPSLLKSSMITACGLLSRNVMPPKVPLPLPSKIEMLLEALLATARSALASVLKSPEASDNGCDPTAVVWGAPKPPAPLFRITDAWFAKPFEMPKSALPSPLKSLVMMP